VKTFLQRSQRRHMESQAEDPAEPPRPSIATDGSAG
jgi:hypothetical protein